MGEPISIMEEELLGKKVFVNTTEQKNFRGTIQYIDKVNHAIKLEAIDSKITWISLFQTVCIVLDDKSEDKK